MCPLGYTIPASDKSSFIQRRSEITEPHPDAKTCQIDLALLATSDVHAHLLSYDYFSDRPAETSSLTRLATLIGQERAASANCILVDNGDFLQGTPIADLFIEGSVPDDMDHPVMAAMNALGYDAAALGNHEFNIALPDLRTVLAQAEFPLLAANIAPSATGQEMLDGMWQGRCILTRRMTDTEGRTHDLRIGLFGVLPPQILAWDRSRIGDKIVVRGMVEAAREATAQLRAEGADVVIALAHTGLGPETASAGMENAGRPIAAIDGIDALVLGHTHLAFPAPDPSGDRDRPDTTPQDGRLNGTPMVMPGSAGAFLGRIDLCLRRHSPETGWQVASREVRLLPASPSTCAAAGCALPSEDPDLRALLEPAHQRTLARIRRPVGVAAHPIHSFFCVLPGCHSVFVVAEAQRRHVARRIAGTPLAKLPLLSASAPQKNGGRGGSGHFTNIPAGPVALSHITDLQFFPNDIAALRLTGAEIADWLEMSASIYARILPGQEDQPLLDPDFPAYNSDTIFGLTYEIDLTQPPRYRFDGRVAHPDSRRIRDIRHNQVPVTRDDVFLLAVNNYRSGGGGYFPHVTPDRTVFEEHTKVRDLICDLLAEADGGPQMSETPWRFRPIPGASVVFDTGHEARDILETEAQVPGEVVGQTAEGFLRMRVRLDG